MIDIGDAGDRFFVVLTRAHDSQSWPMLGGANDCSLVQSPGCGDEFNAWTDETGEVPEHALLGLAQPAPTALSLRLWSAECTIGDLDDDGVVDSIDLGIVLGEWDLSPWSIADLNGDHLVNAEDFAQLLASWTD